MQRILYLPIALLLCQLYACSTQNNKVDDASDTALQPGARKDMYAEMDINDTIRTGDSLLLTFKVYNPTDSAKKFLKWQTPFEPLLSKYLDIKDEKNKRLPT